MFFLFAYFLHLNHLGISPGRFLESIKRLELIQLQYFQFKNLLIWFCLFVCLFSLFSFESSQDTPRMIFWKFRKDWTWFSWDIVKLKFVYLFVCLFVYFCFFIWIISRKFFWKFFKDRTLFSLDIFYLKTVYLFVCLFVYGFVCFLF